MRRKYVIRPVVLAMVICGFLFMAVGDGRAQWPEQTKLIPSDGITSDYFGYSVCIDGDYAAIGAQYDDHTYNDAGSAYIFKKPGGGWENMTETKKLTASDRTAYDYFGRSVSISGDYAIVGAYGRDDNGSSSGAAYIFERIGGKGEGMSDDRRWRMDSILDADSGKGRSARKSAVSIE